MMEAPSPVTSASTPASAVVPFVGGWNCARVRPADRGSRLADVLLQVVDDVRGADTSGRCLGMPTPVQRVVAAAAIELIGQRAAAQRVVELASLDPLELADGVAGTVLRVALNATIEVDGGAAGAAVVAV